ncbi:unnamed protein product [Closterium sp. NIES-65]|nr:unnamed protein product [Closterium sp. NIES-65]
MAPTAPFEPQQRKSQQEEEPPAEILPGVEPEGWKRTGEQLAKIPWFGIPEWVRETYEGMHHGEMQLPGFEGPVTLDTYKKRFELLLHVEELQMEADIRYYDIRGVPVLPCGSRNVSEFYQLTVPGLAEKRPSVLLGDRVYLTFANEAGARRRIEYQGFVHRVERESAILRFHPDFHRRFIPGQLFNVRFEVPRGPVRACHLALGLANRHLGQHVLMPSEIPQRLFSIVPAIRPFDRRLNVEQREAVAQPLLLNVEQREAVAQLLVRSRLQLGARPEPYLPPYIVFGPPGTGKTKTVVEAILQPSARPKPHLLPYIVPTQAAAPPPLHRPYIVFGLPGTGMTKSVFDNVQHPMNPVVKGMPLVRVLVCAPSNSATDNIALRLRGNLQSGARVCSFQQRKQVDMAASAGGYGSISRWIWQHQQVDMAASAGGYGSISRWIWQHQQVDMAASTGGYGSISRWIWQHQQVDMAASAGGYDSISSRGRDEVDTDLLPFTRYDDSTGTFRLPSLSEIHTARVVAVTCCSAALLYRMGVPRGTFTHIFIDEAGHAIEPEGIIPIACHAAPHAVILLAGDHKQLGPEDGSYIGYNTSAITKLVKNYRSHPKILELPNEMFYEGELEACADEMVRSSLCRWDELPNKNEFPIIFHGVMGKDEREGNSPSFFNPFEATVVLKYITSLMGYRSQRVPLTDIGVVTPYRKQMQKLQHLLRGKGMDAVKVGSVEEFQGQERRVVIVSTVRSSQQYVEFDYKHNLGFLANPKRFNVAVTRAKQLLIIVGNPNLLAQDRCWGALLQYCLRNKAYTGCPLPASIPPPDLPSGSQPGGSEDDDADSARAGAESARALGGFSAATAHEDLEWRVEA